MSISALSGASANKDGAATTVKKNDQLDKDTFLKILSAELSNQDPTNAKDGTEFVSQMAQFSALEQMANLNSTMKFTGMTGLVGKNVVLNSTDNAGNLYSGQVKDVVRDGDDVILDVLVGKEKDKDGNLVDSILEFNSDKVLGVKNSEPDNSLEEDNQLMAAAQLIGDNVTLSDTDENKNPYQGVVKAVARDSDGIKITVLYDKDNNKMMDFSLDKITSVKQN